jgi:hypothetical protein
LNLRWTHDLSDEDALDRFVGGLTDMGGPCAETLEEVRAAPGGVDLVLHPAALPVQVRVAEEGLTAAAFTLSLGPGYHAHVATALTFAAEQAGFRAAHPSIDSFLASEALEPITQVCEDYFAAQLAIPGRQRHVGVDALRLQHDARYMLPTGPWRADERPHADAVSLWWFAGVTDEMRCRRAEYQMRFVIPPRPPLDELEVARMESVCDDLEGLHERGPDVPALLALRGGWRALHDWLGELRERPKHLDEVAADETLFLRRGPVQVRAHPGNCA